MNDVSELETWQRLLVHWSPEARLLSVERLEGGVSAQVAALMFETATGERSKLVARTYRERALAEQKQLLAQEYELLAFANSVGLPVPQPYFYDGTCTFLGRPVLLMEFIEGEVILEPEDLEAWSRPVVAAMKTLHNINWAGVIDCLKWHSEIFTNRLAKLPSKPEESLQETVIHHTLAEVWPLPMRNDPSIIHCDIWRGNLLWNAGELVAILDWEDALIGDPLIDLAHARLELCWAWGFEAMETFTEIFLQARPELDVTDMPYWDLAAALRPIPAMLTWHADPGIREHLRTRHQQFVKRALAGPKELPHASGIS